MYAHADLRNQPRHVKHIIRLIGSIVIMKLHKMKIFYIRLLGRWISLFVSISLSWDMFFPLSSKVSPGNTTFMQTTSFYGWLFTTNTFERLIKNMDIKGQIEIKLNMCFLLKHNIGDCVVHLDWLNQTVLFWWFHRPMAAPIITFFSYDKAKTLSSGLVYRTNFYWWPTFPTVVGFTARNKSEYCVNFRVFHANIMRWMEIFCFAGSREGLVLLISSRVSVIHHSTSQNIDIEAQLAVLREKFLMSWVVVIPKEGWARVAAPILLLVWHRLLFLKTKTKKKKDFFLKSRAHPSFGMTPTQAIGNLFV